MTQKSGANDLIYLKEDTATKALLLGIKEEFSTKKKFIGEGGFAKTYEVIVKSLPYLVKKMKHYDLKELARELAPFYFLGKHPNIVTYIGAFKDGNGQWVFAMEKASDSLANFLKSEDYDSVRTPATAKKIKANLTLGVLHVHEKGIAHGDLKTENAVVFLDNPKKTLKEAKLIDFGTMSSDRQKESTQLIQDNSQPKQKFSFMLFCGN